MKKKILTLAAVVTLPFILLVMYLLASMASYSNTYSEIVSNMMILILFFIFTFEYPFIHLQMYNDFCSFFHFAVDFNVTTIIFHHMFDNGQSKTCSARLF